MAAIGGWGLTRHLRKLATHEQSPRLGRVLVGVLMCVSAFLTHLTVAPLG